MNNNRENWQVALADAIEEVLKNGWGRVMIDVANNGKTVFVKCQKDFKFERQVPEKS